MPTVHFDTSDRTLPSSSRLIAFAVFVYVPLALAAMAWAGLGGDRFAWTHPSPSSSAPYPERLLLSLVFGAVLGVAVVALTPVLSEQTAWARALQRELEPIAKMLSSGSITLLALLSGISEELFFRGAMQPALGLLVTSIIFGALHTGPKRAFIAWSVWAFVMGLLFGWIFDYTGVLLGPVLAHVFINQRNLTYMKRH